MAWGDGETSGPVGITSGFAIANPPQTKVIALQATRQTQENPGPMVRLLTVTCRFVGHGSWAVVCDSHRGNVGTGTHDNLVNGFAIANPFQAEHCMIMATSQEHARQNWIVNRRSIPHYAIPESAPSRPKADPMGVL